MVFAEKIDKKSRLEKLFKEANYYESYYSGSDCGVFIGPVWVDDIVSIQFTLQNNKAPVHGYMSESFDAVAKGTYIVQGQFAIAFTEANYLSNILSLFKQYFRQDYSDENDFFDLYNTKDIEKMSMENLLDVRNGNGTRLIRPDQFNYIKKNYEEVVDKGFDIYITYGDLTDEYRGGTAILLSDVHITSRSLVAQTSGEPIAEIYSFFAKDIDDNVKSRYAMHGAMEEMAADAELQVKQAAVIAEYAERTQPEPDATEILTELNSDKDEFKSLLTSADTALGTFNDTIDDDKFENNSVYRAQKLNEQNTIRESYGRNIDEKVESMNYNVNRYKAITNEIPDGYPEKMVIVDGPDGIKTYIDINTNRIKGVLSTHGGGVSPSF